MRHVCIEPGKFSLADDDSGVQTAVRNYFRIKSTPPDPFSQIAKTYSLPRRAGASTTLHREKKKQKKSVFVNEHIHKLAVADSVHRLTGSKGRGGTERRVHGEERDREGTAVVAGRLGDHPNRRFAEVVSCLENQLRGRQEARRARRRRRVAR